MSDKHLQTRKSLVFNSGIFGISGLSIIGTAGLGVLGKLFTKGVGALFGSGLLGSLVLVGFLLISVPSILGAFKAFRNLDYSKAQRKAWWASLSSLGLLLLYFLV